jgi:hypothetical protein
MRYARQSITLFASHIFYFLRLAFLFGCAIGFLEAGRKRLILRIIYILARSAKADAIMPFIP